MPALPPPNRVATSTTIVPRSSPIAQLRRSFLRDGVAPEDRVSPQILRSWARCAALGLDMDRRPRLEPLSRHELREHHDRADRLRAAAASEIEILHHDVRATDGIVILSDADGLVLDTRGSAEFADRAARVALRPGVLWDEAATGTNAIGTAIAERRDVSVVGAEHYFEDNRVLSCTAMPIFGARGDIVGVLDLSNPAEVLQTLAPALLRRAVAAIERRLFDGWAEDVELVRFHLDRDAVGDAQEGLLAFSGDRLVGANRQGLVLVERGWEAIDATRWGEIFAGPRNRIGEDGSLRTLRGRALFGRLERPTSHPRLPARDGAAVRDRSASATRDRAPAQDRAEPPRATAREPGEPILDDRLRKALERATRLVDADVPVLVQGETGAGKEVFARALHAASQRRDRPFVAVNCAALPEGLIEAELFGYEEGAFTGARRQGSKGLLREADGGVLFLDEIGDMPLALQGRLLRALQEREVSPLGGGRPVKVEFALVCATHRGLAGRVETGDFRQDLYFRIAQYTVELDPLRAHPDLAGVIARLWNGLGAEGRGVRLDDEVTARLAAHDWPGNWRQLTATLRTLLVLAEPGETLGLDALPADIRRASVRPCEIGSPREFGALRPVAPRSEPSSPDDLEPDDLEAVTIAAMRAALAASGGNVTGAARRLGIHRSTLYRRLLGEERPDRV